MGVLGTVHHYSLFIRNKRRRLSMMVVFMPLLMVIFFALMMMVAAFFLMMVVALFLLVAVALTLLVVVALTLLVVVALVLMMVALVLMMVAFVLMMVALLLMMMFCQYLLHQLRSQISIAFKGVQDILSIQLLQRRRNHGRLLIVFSHQIDRFLHRLLIGSVRSC